MLKTTRISYLSFLHWRRSNHRITAITSIHPLHCHLSRKRSNVQILLINPHNKISLEPFFKPSYNKKQQQQFSLLCFLAWCFFAYPVHNHGIELILCLADILVFFLTFNLFLFFLHFTAVFFINLFALTRCCFLFCFFNLLVLRCLLFNFYFMILLNPHHRFTLVNCLRTISKHTI